MNPVEIFLSKYLYCKDSSHMYFKENHTVATTFSFAAGLDTGESNEV